MKKLIAIFTITYLLMALPILAIAQTFHPADQKTIAWEAAERATFYRIYVKPATGGDEVLLGETEATQYTATMPSEGRWYIGVESVRVVDGEEVGTSAISWSSDPAVCMDGEAFGVIFFEPPGAASGLRAQ